MPTDLFPGRSCINLSKTPILGCYMYGRFLDRKGSGQTDQGEPRFSPKVASRSARPAIRQSWRFGEISPRGPGAMDADSSRGRHHTPTARNPPDAGIRMTAVISISLADTIRNIDDSDYERENSHITCREPGAQWRCQIDWNAGNRTSSRNCPRIGGRPHQASKRQLLESRN